MQRNNFLVALVACLALSLNQLGVSQVPNTENRPAQVAGVVTLPDGKPAVNAAVYLLRAPQGAYILPVRPKLVHTDNSGKYSFDNVEPGSYRLWSESSGFTSLQEKLRGLKIEVPVAQVDQQSLDLRLHEGCRYLVKVIDQATGKAVSNANISFGWTDIERNYKTDAKGAVEIAGLAIDEWYFVVKAEDFAIAYRKVPKQPLGATTELIFELAPGSTVTGIVRDDKGKAVGGAKISASDKNGGMTPGFGRTVSGADGKFTLASLPRGIVARISIEADGFLRFNEELTVPIDQPEFRQEFALVTRPYGGDCIVTVTDDNGLAIAGAVLENVGNSSADVRRATTGENGIARLSDLYSSYRGTSATVRAPGYISQRIELVSGTKEQPGTISVSLSKGESIRGRLVKPNGDPAAGIWVFYNRGEQGFGGLGGRVDTDQEGRFKIDGLPRPCTFTFYTPAPYAPIRNLELPVGGEDEVVVTMEDEGLLKLRAIDAVTRQPIREFNVQLTFTRDGRPGDPSMGLPSNLTNPGTEILGNVTEFRLGQLPPGMPLQVTVSAKGYTKKVLERVEATTEKESKLLDVELVPEDEKMFRTLAGHVRDTRGKPVVGANVRLIVGTGEHAPERSKHNWYAIESGQIDHDPACIQFLSTTSDRDGAFKFERVKKGQWLEIVHTGGHAANGWYYQSEAALDAVNLKELAIEAVLPATIKVTVDRDRFPEANSVMISPVHEMAFRSTTLQLAKDSKEVVIDRLPPGTYSVSLCAKPIDLGNGGFRTQSLISVQVTVEEDQTHDTSF